MFRWPVIIFPMCLLMLYFVFGSITYINDDYVGVLIQKGDAKEVLDSGFHFANKFKYNVREVKISTQKIDVTSSSVTNDVHTVNITAVVSFHALHEYADKIGMYSGYINKDISIKKLAVPSYVNMLVIPSIQESINTVIARFSAEQLMANWEKMNEFIIDEIALKLSKHGVVIEDLCITGLEISV